MAARRTNNHELHATGTVELERGGTTRRGKSSRGKWGKKDKEDEAITECSEEHERVEELLPALPCLIREQRDQEHEDSARLQQVEPAHNVSRHLVRDILLRLQRAVLFHGWV